ncbi:Cullin repeat-like-containing domain protein [Ephemerocybe angulata]|uniref:Cullin repeat-like-containing domain protein n=1 Tax=Ephemerocybe angulata TaxID=980116 RepID=A0A8H6I356_9AGAR|nr:Cullin repeat-like-containing domain protein [Tulosesus angulatus]
MAQLETAPPPAAKFEIIWAYLRSAVEYIMASEGPLSIKAHTAVYSAVYECCAQDTRKGHSARPDGPKLYIELVLFFTSQVEDIRHKTLAQKEDSELIRCYAREWAQYRRGALSLRSLFVPLARAYLKRAREFEEDKKHILHEVHTLALVLWKTNFFTLAQNSGPRITSALMRMIARERNGEDVDQDVIRSVVDSFSHLSQLE